jgi:ABC-type transport system involved in multi-copper enzyme maturation permease subunit
MNALVRKEIRMLLPAWGITMALTLLLTSMLQPWDLLHGKGGFEFLVFAVGMLLLGLAPFGRELSSGTFSLLLSHPTSRQRIWRLKCGLTLAAMLSIWIALVLIYHHRTNYTLQHLDRELTSPYITPENARRDLQLMLHWIHWSSLVVLLCAFAGGLWSTLLFRQVGAAFWFTILVPGLLLVLVEYGMKYRGDLAREHVLWIALGVYSAVGFLWARHQFMRAQDAQWLGGTISLPSWTGSRSGVRVLPAVRAPFRTLALKELQSHQITLFIGFGLLMFHTAALMIRKFTHFPLNSESRFVFEAVPCLWLLLPWLVGSIPIAEERRLGTMESQLCLPVSRRKQFVAKFGVMLLLGIFVGGIMPCLLEAIGVAAGVSSDIVSEKFLIWSSESYGPILAFIFLSGVISLLSFYASSASRNTLQALGAAFATVSIFWTLTLWAIDPYQHNNWLWRGPIIALIGIPTMAIVIVALAFRNAGLLQVGWPVWRRNLITIMIGLIAVSSVTAAVYHRTWEFLARLEPVHGPAQISGTIRPTLCFSFPNRFYILLPDSRLWISEHFRKQALDEYDESFDPVTRKPRHRQIYVPVPIDGRLVGSNWVAIAGQSQEVVGLKSDGTLWRVFRFKPHSRNSELPQPAQIGTDTDWTALAGAANHFLALKRDGTLWGWGNNFDGQLGPGPEYFTNGPTQIGKDSDWTKVFTNPEISIGIKRDGSTWKWGDLLVPDAMKSWNNRGAVAHPEPIRCDIDGRDITTWVGSAQFDLVFREDGSAWADGRIFTDLLGSNLPMQMARHFVRVGTESDWASATGDGQVIALKKTGVFLENTADPQRFFDTPAVWRRSTYADWIAVADLGEGPVALAADGTLCAWNTPRNQGGLLAPTRKALWSLNILDATKQP